jgi:hypothetical protein
LSKISEEKIIIDSRSVIGHEHELRLILLLAIDISLYNIEKSNTTRTGATGIPHQYQYLTVSPDFFVSVMQKEKMRFDPQTYHGNDPALFYDPNGNLRYPHFYILQECHDIFEMVVISLYNVDIRIEFGYNLK